MEYQVKTIINQIDIIKNKLNKLKPSNININELNVELKNLTEK